MSPVPINKNRGRQVDGVSLHPGQCSITFSYSMGDLFTEINFAMHLHNIYLQRMRLHFVNSFWYYYLWQNNNRWLARKKASVQFLGERKWLLLNVSVFIWCTIPQMQNKYFKSLYCIPTPWVVMPYRKVVDFFFLFVLLFIGWGFFLSSLLLLLNYLVSV